MPTPKKGRPPVDQAPPEPPQQGRFLTERDAEDLHAYLMTRPCNETFELVVAVRSSKPIQLP